MALSRKALEDILKSFEKSNRINKDAFAVQDERNRVNEHLANTPQEDERGILSKIYDTVNVLDSGRSWGTAQPTEEASRESGFNQAKRLGGTIFSGVEKVGDTAGELLGFTERRIRNLDRMLQEGSITREEYQRMLDKELKDTEWAGTEDKGLGDRTRRAGGVALEATSEILPFMKAGKAAQLTTKGGAAFGATEGLAHGVGSELTDPEGFSPKDVGLETVLAGLLGAGGGKFAQSRRAKADRAVESRYFDDIDAGADDVAKGLDTPAPNRATDTIQDTTQREIAEIDEAMAALDDIPDDIPPSRAADTDPTAAKAVENHKEFVDNYFKSVDKKYSTTLLDRLAPPMEVLKKMGLGKVVRVVRDGHDNMLRMEKAGRKMARNWAQLPGIGNDSSAKIFRSLDGKNVALNVDEKKVADEMRQFYKRMAEDLGLPEESKITDYVPHLFDNKNKNLDPELARIFRENPSGKVNSFFRKRRVNADGYIEDAFKVFDVYNRKAALDLHMSEPLKLMKEATPKLTDSSAKYINRQINIIKNTPEAQSQIMRELENLLKLPEGSATRGSAYARNLIYRGTLGLNPASALRNFSQSANTYSELGNRWTVYGGAKALNAMRKMDLDELIEANVLDDTFTRALRGGNTVRNKAAEIGDDTLWFMFQNVERFNRASAYYGAKGRALKRGLSEADAIKEGAEMARKTQFKFGEIDTPQALSGPIAKNLTQFMSFDVNQARFIKNMFAGSEGMIKKLPEGGYTFSPQGAAKVLRWMGFNAVFMASAGKAIGMDEKDFIPFWEDIMEKQPRTSPLVQLTVGDDSSVGLWNLAVGQDARGEEAPRGEIGKELIEDASGLFIPGGTQFHKTREGLDAVNQGASMTDSGQLRFLTGEEDRLQAGMFGQYSLPQAQEYIESDFELLSEPQTEKVMNLPAPERPQYVDFYKAKRGLPSQRTDVYAEIRKAKENGQIQRAQRLAEEWNNSLMDEFSEVLEKHNGLNDELLEELADLRVYVSNVRL